MKRWAGALVVVIIAAVCAAGSTYASTVPRGFFGVAVNEPTLNGRNPSAEFHQMRVDGVESVSAAVYWNAVQPWADASGLSANERKKYPLVDGVPTNFSATDRLYEHAARRGLTVLPVVVGAPPWQRVNPHRLWSPPMDPEAYGRFVGLLTKRYGTGGSFWAAHRTLPQVPTRDWQIWNEPTGWQGPLTVSVYWDGPKPYQDRYLAMLHAAHTAVHAQDPRGRVLLGGMFGQSWESISDLYDRGVKPDFDGAAIHVYTKEPQNVITSLRNVRAVMDRNGDATKPLVLTEFGWPSALDTVTKSHRYGFETSPRGQAVRLAQAVRLLAKHRRSLHLTQVFWYVWAATDAGRHYVFDYAGLRTIKPSGKVVPKAAEARYRSLARQYEGCQRKVRPARCRI